MNVRVYVVHWVVVELEFSYTVTQISGVGAVDQTVTVESGSTADGTPGLNVTIGWLLEASVPLSVCTGAVSTVGVLNAIVLAGAVLAGTVLAGTVLAGTVLAGTVLAGTVLTGAVSAGATLAGAVLVDVAAGAGPAGPVAGGACVFGEAVSTTAGG